MHESDLLLQCPTIVLMEKQAMTRLLSAGKSLLGAGKSLVSGAPAAWKAFKAPGQAADAMSMLSKNVAGMRGAAPGAISQATGMLRTTDALRKASPLAYNLGKVPSWFRQSNMYGLKPALTTGMQYVAAPAMAAYGGKKWGEQTGKIDGYAEAAVKAQQHPWQTMGYGLMSLLGQGNQALTAASEAKLRDPNTSTQMRVALPMLLQRIAALQQPQQ